MAKAWSASCIAQKGIPLIRARQTLPLVMSPTGFVNTRCDLLEEDALVPGISSSVVMRYRRIEFAEMACQFPYS